MHLASTSARSVKTAAAPAATPPDRPAMDQVLQTMRPGAPRPGERYAPSAWRRRIVFADQSTLQERVLFHADGEPAALEARIFTPNGDLRPLADGRVSRADLDATHTIDRT
jgi:hypothetical protein